MQHARLKSLETGKATLENEGVAGALQLDISKF